MKKFLGPVLILFAALAVGVGVLALFGRGSPVPAGPDPVPLSWRPLLHACLNGLCALLLTVGFLFIRRGSVRGHLTCMVLASLTSLVFLASYIQYHYHAGSIPFRGQGWVRPVYFGILLSHTVLAALVAPLAVTLLLLAALRRFDRHKKIARWTLPVWLYVAVTGVLVYLMLYVWFGAA